MEYTCPKCGEHKFTLVVEQLIHVEFTGDEDDEDHEVFEGPFGDMEWTDDTRASCYDCGHCAPLGEMKGA
jgi:hypothetical protein